MTGIAPADWIGIVPMRIQLLPSYHKCLDSVCREKKYLMMTEAPAIESSRGFVQDILDARNPMIVAIIPGPTVIGWCDIYTPPYASVAHMGKLGIAVHADYRGQGIGPLLLQRALRAARLCGLERVELEVFGSNTRAIQLYKKFDFDEEGVKRRARKIDGVYEDIMIMAHHL